MFSAFLIEKTSDMQKLDYVIAMGAIRTKVFIRSNVEAFICN